MKKYIYFLFAILCLAACEAQPADPSAAESATPKAGILKNSPIPWYGSDAFTVTISCNVQPVLRFNDQDKWFHYYGAEMTSRANNTWALIFDATENGTPDERIAAVDILTADGGKVSSFNLLQEAGQQASAKVEKAVSLSDQGGDVKLEVLANIPFTAVSATEWVHIKELGTDYVSISFEENPEYQPRQATVQFLHWKTEAVIGSVTLTQKRRVSAGIKLVPVWAKYRSDADAFAEIGITDANQDRFIALDDNYVYVSIISNNNPESKWGISVLNRADGSYVKTLRDESGIEKVGLWAASALQVVDNGAGSVLIASNMARKQEGHQLRIYAWEDIDAEPQKVTHVFSNHDASRFGDKMGVSGDWAQGELYFADYTAPSGDRPLLIFPIENGVIGNAVDTYFDGVVSGAANMATLAHLEDDSYIYYGTSAAADFVCCLMKREGNVFTKAGFNLSPGLGFDAVMNGLHVASIGGERYLLWVTHDRDSAKRTSYVKTLQLDGDSFTEGIKGLEGVGSARKYPLAGASLSDEAALVNGNHTGDMAMRQIGNDWYLAALGTGSGIVLYKIEVL